jgi:hypothetical protein
MLIEQKIPVVTFGKDEEHVFSGKAKGKIR